MDPRPPRAAAPRPHPRLHVRHGGRRPRPDARRGAADQLRARRVLHARGLRVLVRATASWACPTRLAALLAAGGHGRCSASPTSSTVIRAILAALVARAAHRHARHVDRADQPRHHRLRHAAQGGADGALVARPRRGRLPHGLAAPAGAGREPASSSGGSHRFVARTRTGRAMRAMSQNREACAVVGVDVQRMAHGHLRAVGGPGRRRRRARLAALQHLPGHGHARSRSRPSRRWSPAASATSTAPSPRAS